MRTRRSAVPGRRARNARRLPASRGRVLCQSSRLRHLELGAVHELGPELLEVHRLDRVQPEKLRQILMPEVAFLAAPLETLLEVLREIFAPVLWREGRKIGTVDKIGRASCRERV